MRPVKRILAILIIGAMGPPEVYRRAWLPVVLRLPPEFCHKVMITLVSWLY